jgi:hypothetical protein
MLGLTKQRRVIGYAMQPNGSDEYVDHTAGTNLNFATTDAFSVGFLVQTSSSAGWALSRNTGSAGAITAGWMVAGHTGSCALLFKGASGTLDVQFTGITAGRYARVVITKSTSAAASGVKCYVNGTDISASRSTVTDTLSGAVTNVGPIRIGARGATGAYFGGRLSQVTVWNKELSGSEATEDFGLVSRGLSALSGSYSANVVFCVPVAASDSVSAINDTASNNYDGTPQNFDVGDIVPVYLHEMRIA